MTVLAEIYVPKETVSDEFATIAKLYVNNGDKVKKGDQLIDLETSKTIVTIEADHDGFIEVFCKEGEDVEISAHLMNIVDTLESKNNTKVENSTQEINNDLELNLDTVFSKSALELIKKHNVDKSKFVNKDFVSEEDVLKIVNPEKVAVQPSQNNVSKVLPSNPSHPIDTKLVDIEPVSKLKKTEIQYLSDVQSGVMNSILNVAVDVGNINEAIEKSFKIFKGSYLPLIVYEVSRLLLKYKMFNAYFMGDNIGYYKNINLGMATDIDDGLKVLTLPNTDKLNMTTIEGRLYDLVEKYLDKKLEVSDVTGSTFTITDLSSSGIDFFTPLINTKQSAILGVSQVDKKLNRFYLTLVFDHRVTEGKMASEFLVELKNRIESYSLADDEEEEVFEESFLDVKCGACFKTLKEDKEIQGLGMIKRVNHQGKEDYICHVCLARY
jgi:pyruvate/2-oxoglutarate dehydrogenase complex dihydrolipoamide acyltransferase (E2) component